MPISDWKHRWARLRSMNVDELQDRIRQQVGARADAWRYFTHLGFPTHLQEPQKPGRFFFEARDVSNITRALEQRMPQQFGSVMARAERICQHRFDLLGYAGLDYGAEIDWHLDVVNGRRAPFKPFHRIHYLDFNEVGDSKIVWELNRHQHLVILAKAFRLSGNPKFSAEVFEQWKHWHMENPYPMGINWASSLEVAFRSLSWIWVYFLLAGSPVLPSWFREDWTRALALSGRHIERYLSTYFSPNTHLLGEGVALFFIGSLCPEIQEASRWQKRGWGIVVEEAQRQVRPDGFHFEQSLYYHVYALDFFLHARILAARNGIEIPAEFDLTIEKMLNAMVVLTANGAPPSFGDDDGGRLFDPQRNRTPHLLDPLATGAVLFQRGDFKALVGDVPEETLWLLGTEALEKFDKLEFDRPVPASAALEMSGLYVMADAASATQLLIDAGPQGTATAGHGHADALSVCISHAGKPLLIDSGTCVYVGDGLERDAFRGTAAHNTMCVDGLDQAIPAGPFGWKNLPKVSVDRWIAGEIFDFFSGHHDGYCRLPKPVVHHRDVFWRKGRFWLVRDRVEGTGTHSLEIRWHLPPDFQEEGRWFASGAVCGIGVLGTEGHGWNMRCEDGSWSPAYGRKEAASIVIFSNMSDVPAGFATLLIPRLSQEQELGVFSRLETGTGEIEAYRYRTDTEECLLFFRGNRASWTVGPYASDAEFLCLGARQDGGRELMFCNGRYVEIAGKPVVSCAEVVQRCELVHGDRGTQMFSSAERGIELRESLADVSFERAGTTAE